MPTNQDWVDRGNDALRQRIPWENKLATFERQRYCMDRQRVNNRPWPNSSNIRYPLSDTIIEQKKAYAARVPFSTERMPVFKAMVPQNLPYAANAAAYYDFIVKEKTEFEIEMIFALDAGKQDGESVMKIMWNMENEVPIFRQIDNLFIITPPTTTMLKDASWIIHVIQMDEEEAKEKWGKMSGFDNFIKSALHDESKYSDGDAGHREADRYVRQGINLSGKTMRLVTWEVHYEENGKRRLRTISPDMPDFDFGDDREYPYHKQNGDSEWMFEEYRRELTNRHQHSSRGVPEVVREFEFTLTAAWRAKQNAMALYNEPMFTAPNGLPPGSTNNFSMIPGGILPGGLQPAVFGTPPMSWETEMLESRQVAERRMMTPDVGLGRESGLSSGQAKTAREAGYIASINNMAMDYETMTWKKFLRSVLRQGWDRVVQYKPKSLIFYINETLETLPQEAINGDYIIQLSWSADSINTEFRAQRAMALWQAAMNNPYANQQEAWKNLCDEIAPGQSQRFQKTPAEAQADMGERIAAQIDVMVSTGYPVRPKREDDHGMAVMETMAFIDAQQKLGRALTPPQINLLSLWMNAHKQMLKQQNPQAFVQLMQQLNMIDQQQHAKVEQQSAQAAMVKQRLGAGALARIQGVAGNGAQVQSQPAIQPLQSQ